MADLALADVLVLHRRMEGMAHVSGVVYPQSTPPRSHGNEPGLGTSSESGSGSDSEAEQNSQLLPGTPSPSRVQHPGEFHIVAIHCKFVGGGLQGAVDLCASVTLLDEWGQVLLDTVVKPSLPVTDYRSPITSLKPEDVARGMPFKRARKTVLGLLRGTSRACSPPGPGPSAPAAPSQSQTQACVAEGDSQVLVVGVNLQHTLGCLMLEHPQRCLRDLSGSVDLGQWETRSTVDIASFLLRQFLSSSSTQ